jgi:hypothetical protein
MWADQPALVDSPKLSTEEVLLYNRENVNTFPEYYAYHFFVPPGSQRISITLDPHMKDTPEGTRVFYDGFTLIEGIHDANQPPVFSDEAGDRGAWNGVPFVNLIRNGSIEKSQPRLNPRLDDLGAKFTGDNARPSLIMLAIADWKANWKIHYWTLARLVRTYYAKFGWGSIPILQGHYPYRWIGILSLLSLVGAAVQALLNRSRIDWAVVSLLLIVIGVSWMAAFVRPSIYLNRASIYFPVARYVYPVVIPTTILLSYGWLLISKPVAWAGRLISHTQGDKPFSGWRTLLSEPEIQIMVYCALYLILMGISVFTLVEFFQRLSTF